MKTLFFIAALLGAVYLIMQTPAGQAWLEESEPEPNVQQEIQDKIQQAQQVSTQAAQSLENKVTELAQSLNQQQQTQINQLENRIAELENELIMGRIDQKQQPSVPNEEVSPQSTQPSEPQLIATSYPQDFALDSPASVKTTDNSVQLQRKRQARLQDIAEKMEMSSLQALVN